MAYPNQNPNLTKEIQAAAGLSNITGYPRQIAESIIPVISINKKVCDVVQYKNSTGTIYTTPADKDFYLTAMSVGGTQTAANKKGSVTITITLNGVAVNVVVACVATGATNTDGGCGNNELALYYPIKLDRGSAITLAVNGDNPNRVEGSIIGFTQDVTGA